MIPVKEHCFLCPNLGLSLLPMQDVKRGRSACGLSVPGWIVVKSRYLGFRRNVRPGWSVQCRR